MKKILLIAASVMTFASCNKSSVLEEQLPIPVRAAAETTSGTAAVEVENGMLKFADEAAIEQTLSMLLKMDEATLSAWYDSIGFVSQESVYEQALNELDGLESETAYLSYREKYQNVFLFNSFDEEDTMPYLPNKQVGYSLILNPNGNVLVDNQVMNCNYTSFAETKYYQSTLPQSKSYDKTENINYLYVHDGKRKFWAEAGRANDVVFIEFTAHKTTIVGWNKYKTKYGTRLNSANDDEYAWKSLNSDKISATVGQELWTGEIKSHTRVQIGVQNKLLFSVGATTAYWPRINRQYYVASRGVPNGGILNVIFAREQVK